MRTSDGDSVPVTRRLVTEVAALTNEILHDYNYQETLWEDDLCGACAIGARIVQLVGRKLGHKPVFTYGKYRPTYWGSHCWTHYGDYLVDPTAEQYEGRDWINISRRQYKQLYKPIYRGAPAVAHVNSRWPYEQSPADHPEFIKDSVDEICTQLKYQGLV